MRIHDRAAALLGWTRPAARSFSLRALREVVRTQPPSDERDEILEGIDAAERAGRVVVGAPAMTEEQEDLVRRLFGQIAGRAIRAKKARAADPRAMRALAEEIEATARGLAEALGAMGGA